jgi:NAD(P)-dependent dehydrogenase (short-subunit alcohol dehydrogenase family)
VFAALDGLPPARLLVNNASRFAYDALGDFSAADWDTHMAVNLRGPALLTQAFAALPAGEDALIVNILDAKLAQPNPDFFTYTISKMGWPG